MLRRDTLDFVAAFLVGGALGAGLALILRSSRLGRSRGAGRGRR